MFDRQAIYRRFAECHSAENPVELAKKLGVRHPFVFRWRSGEQPIPWARLKKVADSEGISWDWLIEGKEPKQRRRRKNEINHPLDRLAINLRFLALYPPVSQVELGKLFGINPTTIFKWRHGKRPVPWERLKAAVDEKNTTWEWLLEGRK